MKILGIVGGIGAGKSTVVQIFSEYANVYTIDADKYGHQILLSTGEAYSAIVEAFGRNILDENNEIIRTKLAKIVFSDQQKLIQLNKITHPIIVQKILDNINIHKKNDEYDIILLDAPLLFEAGLDKYVDKIIGVYANEEIRISRVMKRNNCTKKNVKDRIKIQKNWEEFTKEQVKILIRSIIWENLKFLFLLV